MTLLPKVQAAAVCVGESVFCHKSAFWRAHTWYAHIFSGVYISKTSYIRQGEKSLDGFYRAWHHVEFYRWMFSVFLILVLLCFEYVSQLMLLLQVPPVLPWWPSHHVDNPWGPSGHCSSPTHQQHQVHQAGIWILQLGLGRFPVRPVQNPVLNWFHIIFRCSWNELLLSRKPLQLISAAQQGRRKMLKDLCKKRKLLCDIV